MACAIIAIVVVMALPSYREHLQRVRRLDGKNALYALMLLLEEHYALHHSYLSLKSIPAESPEHFYQLKIIVLDAIHYELAAIPIHAQREDPCGVLSIDGIGNRKSSGNGSARECWG